MECEYCGITSFKCPACGNLVQLKEVTDIFHVGNCSNCGLVDEPCGVSTQDGEHYYTIPWYKNPGFYLPILAVLFIIAGIILEFYR